METTLIIWLSVASVMALVILFRPIKSIVAYLMHNHLIELGKEQEEIWLPGDRLPSQSEIDDEED